MRWRVVHLELGPPTHGKSPAVISASFTPSVSNDILQGPGSRYKAAIYSPRRPAACVIKAKVGCGGNRDRPGPACFTGDIYSPP